MGISHKRFGLTAFKAEVAKINKRMHKVPGKVERHKLFRKAFNAGVASRYYRGKKVYMCTECGCEVQWIGQKECPQCHAKWTAKEVYDFPMRNSWGKPKPPRSLTYAYEVRELLYLKPITIFRCVVTIAWSAPCSLVSRSNIVCGRRCATTMRLMAQG